MCVCVPFSLIFIQREVDPFKFSIDVGTCPLGTSLQETTPGGGLSCRCDAGRTSSDFIGCEGQTLILKVSECRTVCVCVCVRAFVRACVHVCACVCVLCSCIVQYMIGLIHHTVNSSVHVCMMECHVHSISSDFDPLLYCRMDSGGVPIMIQEAWPSCRFTHVPTPTVVALILWPLPGKVTLVAMCWMRMPPIISAAATELVCVCVYIHVCVCVCVYVISFVPQVTQLFPPLQTEGFLCGKCAEGNGISTTFNRCAPCSLATLALIPALSESHDMSHMTWGSMTGSAICGIHSILYNYCSIWIWWAVGCKDIYHEPLFSSNINIVLIQ